MRYTLAKLYVPKNGKDFYVYFSYRNQEGELQRFKERSEINRIKNLKERKAAGWDLASKINEKLKEGWSPLIVTEAEKQSQKTIYELLDEYYLIKKPTVRKRTILSYKYAIAIFKEYLKNERMKPGSFTKVMAHGFSDFLLTTKGQGSKSHNNHLLNISVFFNMMLDREVISKNPFRAVKRKPVESGNNLAYSDKQRNEIKNHLKKTSSPILMLVQFIYYCFIRPNELMQLQVKHIDFKDKRILIPGHISKNRKQSAVEIPDSFFKEVKEKYEKLDPDLYLFGRGLIPHETPVHRNRATEAHKKVLEKLKISNEHTLYSWKHTGAAAFIRAGGNPYDLMRQLRHHSLEQTMIYLRSLGLTANTGFTLKQPKF